MKKILAANKSIELLISYLFVVYCFLSSSKLFSGLGYYFNLDNYPCRVERFGNRKSSNYNSAQKAKSEGVKIRKMIKMFLKCLYVYK